MKNETETCESIETGEVVRGFLVVFVPVTVLVFVIVALVYLSQTKAERDVLDAKEVAGVEMLKVSVHGSLRSVVTDMMVQMTHRELRAFVDNPGPPRRRAAAEEFLAFVRAKGVYDQVRLIDAAGMEVVRINHNDGDPYIVSEERLQSKANRYYFREALALEEGEVYVSPFDLNVEHGSIEEPFKPMIRIGMPVFRSDGGKYGILIVNYLGRELLDNFEKHSAGGPGTTMLLNSEGFWLKGPAASDEWGFMYEGHAGSRFSDRYGEAWKRIIVADTGQLRTGRGLFTFTTVYPISQGMNSQGAAAGPVAIRSGAGEYHWKIVSHVSPELLEARSGRLLNALAVLFGFMVLVVGAGSWYVSQARARRRSVEQGRVRLIGELNSALGSIKTLSGLLPICASCKKIRDDKGYWKKLESYIQDHSEAEFTHGICPECEEKFGSNAPQR